MIRGFFVWLHRWAGLLMAAFLILVGLTGSLLAFASEIDHLVSPRFFAKPQPGVARLDFATLTDRAESLVPQGQVEGIFARPDSIRIIFSPRQNPETGKPYELGLNSLYLNPWTGQELARLKPGESDDRAAEGALIRVHGSLALPLVGEPLLGVVALIWTLDCFVGFYLALPASTERFWLRWKVAWRVKWRASACRVNFDLHRASGLWLWPVLFVFAWSSVMFNLPEVYNQVTGAIFDYRPLAAENSSTPGEGRPPDLDFRTALSTAQRMMAEQAARHGFSVRSSFVFLYDVGTRTYFYNVESSRDIVDRYHVSDTGLIFDGDTGSLRSLRIPTGEHAGNTVTSWLHALHMAEAFGVPYRIFVCVLGLVIAMLSCTGICIWRKKRRGRILAELKRDASFAMGVVQPSGAKP